MPARKSTAARVGGAGGGRPFARFEWMIAARYLRPRRAEAFVSIIALLSFLGIMLGVATLIVVMAVMNGFRAELIDKILGLNGHFIVQASDTPLRDYDAVAKRIAGVPGVVSAIPLIEGQALASGPGVNPFGDEALEAVGSWWEPVACGELHTPGEEDPAGE